MNAKRIKVLYLCGWEIGAHGQGDISFVYEQVESLSQIVEASFIEPKFISYPQLIRNQLRNIPNAKKIKHLWKEEKVHSLQINIPKLSSRITRPSLLQELKMMGSKLAIEVIRLLGEIDIIHAHVVLPSGLIAAELANRLKVPLIIQEHSAPFEMHLDTQEKTTAVKYTFNKASKIISVGQDLYNTILLYSEKDKNIIIPNLLRTDFFSPQPMPPVDGVINLVAIGGLVKRKGYALLIEALSLLNDSSSDIKYNLKIVGEGSERTHLEHLIATKNLKEYITITGHLNRECVRQEIENSHIYIHASEKETFGLAPAEALSIGRPVITTKCGGPEYYVNDDNGLVLLSRDSNSIAQAIKNISSKISCYDPIVLHENIDKLYGPHVFLSNLENVYNSTIEEFKTRKTIL